MKTRKSYRQVPITATKCGKCVHLKQHPNGGHFCKIHGNDFGPEERVPQDFAGLCSAFKKLTK